LLNIWNNHFRRLVEKHWYRLIIVLLLPILFLRVYSYTPVFFDGSFFLLFSGFFGKIANFSNTARLFGHFVFEGPNILATYIWGPNLTQSVLLYSATVVFVPVTILLASYLLYSNENKKVFLYAVVGYCASMSVSLYFEVNEFNLANSLLWLIIPILLNDKIKERSKVYQLGLVTLAMAFTYPYLLFIFPGILVHLKFNMKQRKEKYLGYAVILLVTGLTLLLTIDHSRQMPSTSTNFIMSIRGYLRNIPVLVGLALFASFFLVSV
jgi:hypothetical protein